MKRLIVVASLLFLSACSNMGGIVQSPAQAVFAAKGGYEVALTAAVAYRALPRCSATVKQPCSDAAVVAQLQHAQPAARAALDAAEAIAVSKTLSAASIAASVKAAEAGLAAFTSLTSTLK